MKTKTIKSILRRKFDAYIETITDEPTKELVKNGTIITGGSIVSMLLREEVNDFDLYFKDQVTALAVARYYVAQFLKNPPPVFKDSAHPVSISAHLVGQDGFTIKDTDSRDNARVKIVIKSAGIAGEAPQDTYQYFEGITDGDKQADAAEEYVAGAVQNADALDQHAAEELEGQQKKKDDPKRPKFRPIFLSSNAITLSDKIQLIIRFYGAPEEIHRNYDYVHCTSYWTSWDNTLFLRPEAMECILTKELRYVGSKYPICSVIRARKFLTRGWTINAGQYVKMCWQISKLNLEDIQVLEDQLIGVDSAYFCQLINLLREQNKDREDKQHVDGTYLMTVIDKIF